MKHDTPVALITGANQRIGLQIAKDLAAHGLTVLVGSRNFARGEAAAKTIAGDARAIQLDVAVSPGFTKTNLNNYAGTETVEEGAAEAVRVALLGPDGPTGTFTHAKLGQLPYPLRAICHDDDFLGLNHSAPPSFHVELPA